MTSAIEAVDLHKTYANDVEALRGVSFTVERGTIFALLGPNGAGKSTTVKILTTLSSATSGSATVAGHDVDANPQAVRQSIGVVAQKSGADPEATGRENMLLQGRLFGIPKHDLEPRVDELLGRFGLGDAAGRLVRTYSGGMVRKLDVAMGLIQRPDVLFLDEPTTGLHPEARADVWAEIDRLAGEESLTILLTTHYLDEADALAANLAIVDKGEIIARGTPEELKRDLRGDAIRAELVEVPGEGDIDRALAGVDAIREVEIDGHELRARADDGAAAAVHVLAALDGAGVKVASVTVARPSLDDVYLQFTGHRFVADGAEGSES